MCNIFRDFRYNTTLSIGSHRTTIHSLIHANDVCRRVIRTVARSGDHPPNRSTSKSANRLSFQPFTQSANHEVRQPTIQTTSDKSRNQSLSQSTHGPANHLNDTSPHPQTKQSIGQRIDLPIDPSIHQLRNMIGQTGNHPSNQSTNLSAFPPSNQLIVDIRFVTRQFFRQCLR